MFTGQKHKLTKVGLMDLCAPDHLCYSLQAAEFTQAILNFSIINFATIFYTICFLRLGFICQGDGESIASCGDEGSEVK